MRKELRISGFGGQGVILSGLIVGQAVSIHDGNNASFTQSYGPEARGGACASQVVISDKIVDYPLVNQSDILVSLSQTAYAKFFSLVREGGDILIDSDLVKPLEVPKGAKIHSIPATRFAEELGNTIVGNIVMLGFLTRVTQLASKEAMIKAIRESVPERFMDLNMAAFERGYEYQG
ncbi:2-oxoacid:acceptor oxidoreductase family protein [bacterium]|nr:2-oxoacid:acceptor oxidoreductase family protein [bacterium]